MAKKIILLVALISLLTITVNTTLAFQSDSCGPLDNVMTVSRISTAIEERLVENVKYDVQVKNTGVMPAYVRAAVIVSWKDQAGNIWSQMPIEDIDYTITWYDETDTIPDDWFKGADGYYYHKAPVLSEVQSPNDCSTSILFTECTPKENVTPPADGFTLCVEILCSGIQTEPVNAVETAWPSVQIENGNLVRKAIS